MILRQQFKATFKLGLGLAAVLVLAGAKGQGCGSSPPGEPETPVCTGCADGYELQTVCSELCAVAIDPDGNETTHCEPEVCEEICVPIDDCPPGYHGELICGEPTAPAPDHADDGVNPMPGPHSEDCELICLPDDECDPTQYCLAVETCVDGLLYPSSCGPDNCDAPIGDCEPECDSTLNCGQALTCFDGVLYPTTCGPANCDEPIGDC